MNFRTLKYIIYNTLVLAACVASVAYDPRFYRLAAFAYLLGIFTTGLFLVGILAGYKFENIETAKMKELKLNEKAVSFGCFCDIIGAFILAWSAHWAIAAAAIIGMAFEVAFRNEWDKEIKRREEDQ